MNNEKEEKGFIEKTVNFFRATRLKNLENKTVYKNSYMQGRYNEAIDDLNVGFDEDNVDDKPKDIKDIQSHIESLRDNYYMTKEDVEQVKDTVESTIMTAGALAVTGGYVAGLLGKAGVATALGGVSSAVFNPLTTTAMTADIVGNIAGTAIESAKKNREKVLNQEQTGWQGVKNVAKDTGKSIVSMSSVLSDIFDEDEYSIRRKANENAFQGFVRRGMNVAYDVGMIGGFLKGIKPQGLRNGAGEFTAVTEGKLKYYNRFNMEDGIYNRAKNTVKETKYSYIDSKTGEIKWTTSSELATGQNIRSFAGEFANAGAKAINKASEPITERERLNYSQIKARHNATYMEDLSNSIKDNESFKNIKTNAIADIEVLKPVNENFKPISGQEIIDYCNQNGMATTFVSGLNKGKSQSKRRYSDVYGVYNSNNNTVEVRSLNDVVTIAHEQTHADTVGRPIPLDARNELMKYANSKEHLINQEPNVAIAEAQADFGELWYLNNKKAREVFPVFTEFFENNLRQNGLLDTRLQLREMIRQYCTQPDEFRIVSALHTKDKLSRWDELKLRYGKAKTEFLTEAVDRNYALENKLVELSEYQYKRVGDSQTIIQNTNKMKMTDNARAYILDMMRDKENLAKTWEKALLDGDVAVLGKMLGIKLEDGGGLIKALDLIKDEDVSLFNEKFNTNYTKEDLFNLFANISDDVNVALPKVKKYYIGKSKKAIKAITRDIAKLDKLEESVNAKYDKELEDASRTFYNKNAKAVKLKDKITSLEENRPDTKPLTDFIDKNKQDIQHTFNSLLDNIINNKPDNRSILVLTKHLKNNLPDALERIFNKIISENVELLNPEKIKADIRADGLNNAISKSIKDSAKFTGVESKDASVISYKFDYDTVAKELRKEVERILQEEYKQQETNLKANRHLLGEHRNKIKAELKETKDFIEYILNDIYQEVKENNNTLKSKSNEVIKNTKDARASINSGNVELKSQIKNVLNGFETYVKKNQKLLKSVLMQDNKENITTYQRAVKKIEKQRKNDLDKIKNRRNILQTQKETQKKYMSDVEALNVKNDASLGLTPDEAFAKGTISYRTAYGEIPLNKLQEFLENAPKSVKQALTCLEIQNRNNIRILQALGRYSDKTAEHFIKTRSAYFTKNRYNNYFTKPSASPESRNAMGSELQFSDNNIDNYVRRTTYLLQDAILNSAKTETVKLAEKSTLPFIFETHEKGHTYGDNSFQVWIDGKKKNYTFIDPDVALLFKDATANNIGKINEVMALTLSAFKFTATGGNLMFAIQNGIVDSTTYWLNTMGIKRNLKQSLPFYGLINGIMKQLSQEDILKEKNLAGVSTYTKDANLWQKADIKNSKYTKYPKMAYNLFLGVIDAVEQANRIDAYEAARNAGYDWRFARYVANNATTDFARRGRNSIISYGVYLNPHIQSLYTDYNIAKRAWYDPAFRQNLCFKAGILVLSSLGLWYKNKDEEWYKNLSTYDKVNYIHLSKDYRIKSPYLIGFLSMKIPESIANASYDGDTYYLKKEVKESLYNNLGYDFISSIPAINAIIAGWLGYDLQTGRNIEPMSMQNNTKVSERFDNKTTRVAKFIGKNFNVSPKITDAVLEKLFGPSVEFADGVYTYVNNALTGANDYQRNLLRFKQDYTNGNTKMKEMFNDIYREIKKNGDKIEMQNFKTIARDANNVELETKQVELNDKLSQEEKEKKKILIISKRDSIYEEFLKRRGYIDNKKRIKNPEKI